MNKDELSTFLHNRTEQIESFISTFEMNNQSREKGLLSLDGMLKHLLIKLIKTKVLIRFSKYVIIGTF